MFKKRDKPVTRHYDTLISSKTTVTGDVKFKGGLQVEGIIKGDLIADPSSGAVVRVSEHGRVEGNISAPSVIINGIVHGDIHADEYIELAKKARVKGDVYYDTMEMVLGSAVSGKLYHQLKNKVKTNSTLLLDDNVSTQDLGDIKNEVLVNKAD